MAKFVVKGYVKTREKFVTIVDAESKEAAAKKVVFNNPKRDCLEVEITEVVEVVGVTP